MSNATEPRRQDQGRLIAEAAESIRKTQRYLLSIQRSDGHWCGELEGDSILGSEYVMAMMFLGMLPDPRVAKAAESIRRKQLPDGGWAIYPGRPFRDHRLDRLPALHLMRFFKSRVAGSRTAEEVGESSQGTQ